MAIDQNITPLPEAPQRQDAPSDFIEKADAHVASLDTFVTQLNIWAGEANTTQVEINQSESDASDSKDAAQVAQANAESARDIAAANANFMGLWVNLTGAATIPYSVLHSNNIWMLIQNIGDVQSVEPGTNPGIWVSIATTTGVAPDSLALGGETAAQWQAKIDSAKTIARAGAY